jgi:hypothetical protein
MIDLYTIINLKRKGKSNREIARECGWDRKTVNKYWNHYNFKVEELGEENVNVTLIQEEMLKVKYDSTNRSMEYAYNLDCAYSHVIDDEGEDGEWRSIVVNLYYSESEVKER